MIHPRTRGRGPTRSGLTRRGFLAGATALGVGAATGALSGCSGSGSDGAMTFWNFYGPGGDVPAQADWFVELAEAWNREEAAGPRERIDLRFVPAPDYQNGSTLSTSFAAEQGPDVFLLSPGDFLRYANAGLLVDLTPYLEPGAREDYVEGALETRTIDDQVFGLPMEIEPLAIYYRPDFFEDAGLSEGDLPTTWDQLLDVADKVRTDDRFGVQFETIPGYYQNFTWYPFMWMGGGSPVNSANDASTFDSRPVTDALELWGTTVRERLAPRGPLGGGGGDINANLMTGYSAMQQTGVWAVAEYLQGENKDLPLGVFKLPVPDGGEYTTSLGGWAFVANARGRNPEAAARFCAWSLAAQDAAGIERARQWNTVVKTNIPPRQSVRDAADQQGAFTGLFKTFVDEIAVGGRGEPRYPAQIYKAVSDAIQGAQLGGRQASSAAERATEIIDSFIPGYRGARIL